MTESAFSCVLLGVDWYGDPNVERINHYHLLDRRRIDRLRAMSILVARPASLINQESMKNQITIDGIDWEMAEQRPLSQTLNAPHSSRVTLGATTIPIASRLTHTDTDPQSAQRTCRLRSTPNVAHHQFDATKSRKVMPHTGLPLLSWASPIFQKLRLNSTVKWESTPLGATP